MVAVIKVGQSIRRMMQYNENKVTQGNALIIGSANYPVDAVLLSCNARLNRMERQLALNRKVQRNSLHISLNFDPSEKQMPSEKMAAIAADYMERLGFAAQPYVVYRHFDAGHPHLHVVTTNIQSDGSRIDLHHLAIRKSEPARIALEKEYKLVAAKGRFKNKDNKNVMVTKALYGRSETRTAIQNVLEIVLDKYRYTSLSQLNAVLQLYNIRADSGTENSRISRHGGLQYRVLNEKGIPLSVPLKASLFYNRPTLARLQKKIAANAIVSAALKGRIKNVVDSLDNKASAMDFIQMKKQLLQQGIDVVERRNDKGLLYGLTYIDHKSGGIFNGSELGKTYSAKAMQERFTVVPEGIHQIRKVTGNTAIAELLTLAGAFKERHPEATSLVRDIAGILSKLTQVENVSGFVRGIGNKKKRKRRKRGTSD